MAKPAASDAPSYDYLLNLRTELEDDYVDDDKQIDRMRKVREQKNEVVLPQGMQLVDIKVLDPTCTDEIQRVAATLSVNRPRMQVKPMRQTDTAQENATLREHWTEEVLWRAGSREPGPNAFERLVDATVGDGAGWVKLLCDFDRWEARYSIKRKDYQERIEEEEEGDPENEDQADADEADEPGESRQVRRASSVKKIKQTNWDKYNEATEDAKKADVPFVLTSVDVRTVYPVFDGESGIREVLEVSQRSKSQAFRQYRLKEGKDGTILSADDDDLTTEELGLPEPVKSEGKDSAERSKVTFLEHHDQTYTTYVIAGTNHKGDKTGKVVAQWKHRMRRPPYFWAPGIWQSHWRNKKVGWSISESKRWLVEYRSYLWTVHSQICARDAWAPLMRKMDPNAPRIVGEDKRPKKDEKWQLGVIYDLKPGEELVPLVFPPVAQALQEEIKIIGEAIERLETPRVSGSIGGGLEGAGYAVNQILSEAKLRFQPISSSIERCLVDLTKFLWQLVREKIKEDVWVYRDGPKNIGWIKAGPKDLSDTLVEWNLDPEKPSAKVIESRYHHERLQAGTEDLTTAISRMGDNPDEIRVGLALDRMRASSWYQDYQQRYVLSKAARGDLLKRAADAENQAQSGNVPGPDGGPPPGPGGPGGPAMGMGGAGVAGGGGPQDMANLAMAPHGAGAAPVGAPGVGMGPGPGGIPGVGPGAVMPQQAAMAGIQRIQ